MEATIEVPFRATLVVDGDLHQNLNGYSRASDLLTEKERTLPFSGVLRLTNVSRGEVRTIPLPGQSQCGEGVGFISEHSSMDIPITATDVFGTGKPLSDLRLPSAKKIFEWIPAIKRTGTNKASADKTLPQSSVKLMSASGALGPVITNPDGVLWHPLYTTQEVRPFVGCGFNDLSIPINGVFNVQVRQYYEYQRGTLIRQWQDKRETFSHCWPA